MPQASDNLHQHAISSVTNCIDVTDLEKTVPQDGDLVNDAIYCFDWKNLTVSVGDRNTKQSLPILLDSHGYVEAGEMLAIMGPSGAGKTTLLNAIAHRSVAASATVEGQCLVNGRPTDLQQLRYLSAYVGQEDALIGSLTVREIMSFAAGLSLASRTKASIHQPSTATFNLFDKLCLLAKGETCYFGKLSETENHFASVGYNMPHVNTDLARQGDATYLRVQRIAHVWRQGRLAAELHQDIGNSTSRGMQSDISMMRTDRPALLDTIVVLLHRAWIKAFRDVIAYGIRGVMYLGLAILMGTVFLRLKDRQADIFPYTNAIFFGGAFMSFMAVAYVPAFLEDLHTFRKERANGLVGPLAFNIANFIIGLPFMFMICFVFSAVEYFLTGFRDNADAFFRFLMWLFLDLVAAESLVVLLSTIFPVFVVALAATAFANGLWTCVDGFLVPLDILNPFWKTTSIIKLMSSQYYCMYQDSLNAQGKFRGTAVLGSLSIKTGLQSYWIAYMIAIIVGYRVLAYLALWARKC
ncbi:hypothetical protein BAUCODRAFT_23874 [Baudoinia panamericana UAMH 10762]|uniref:ABC transporter domain-containing protein n=1 Tax=Baudoinia panamericana (strain UAMH 10762) TaxID=717646 RepID=M2LSY1_BAUPA|nr:uncharacterized protein BAUCODRAFT_23874 [Baudoinia panamericana UAMH 10762]EMC97612.1 hypothetical protein BAUCODRAFT_23874 [Baudoinia panamericana UAMH 10762]